MAQEYPTPITPLPSEPKKSNTNLIIIIVVVVVLLCCCCGLALLAWFYGDQVINQFNSSTSFIQSFYQLV